MFQKGLFSGSYEFLNILLNFESQIKEYILTCQNF